MDPEHNLLAEEVATQPHIYSGINIMTILFLNLCKWLRDGITKGGEGSPLLLKHKVVEVGRFCIAR